MSVVICKILEFKWALHKSIIHTHEHMTFSIMSVTMYFSYMSCLSSRSY